MPRRGLDEQTPSVFNGSLYLTAAQGIYAAGAALGRPLNGTWDDVHDHDKKHAVMVQGATGKLSTIFYPPEETGALRPITLRLTRYDIALYEALESLFADGAKFDVVIRLLTGRVFTGKAKPNRLDNAKPLSAPGDHPFFGGQGRDLTIRLISTEGSFA